MTMDTSPFGKLQASFGQGSAPPQGMDYTHTEEEKFRSILEASLNKSETGAALLLAAQQNKIVVRIIRGKQSSGFIPESRAIFIGIPPELSTPNPETVLALGAYLRQAQLEILGRKNPDDSMSSLDKAIAFDSKILDSIVTMCKITSEQYANGHKEFLDALLRMGHGELYESFKKDGTGPQLVELFYKIYIKNG
jgi:hypothetical protein